MNYFTVRNYCAELLRNIATNTATTILLEAFVESFTVRLVR